MPHCIQVFVTGVKALGFPPRTVALLILAEALLLAAIGGAIGMLLTAPVVQVFHAATISVFAKMPLVPQTFYLQAACALVVGVVAGIVPAIRAGRIRIVDGLRHVA